VTDDLARIRAALLDLVDAVLRRELPRGDEGWLSEETPDAERFG
jgi:hypothetical protein